jgi:hypothetical protein
VAAVRGGRLAIGEIRQLKEDASRSPMCRTTTLARDGHTTDVGIDERVVPALEHGLAPGWRVLGRLPSAGRVRHQSQYKRHSLLARCRRLRLFVPVLSRPSGRIDPQPREARNGLGASPTSGRCPMAICPRVRGHLVPSASSRTLTTAPSLPRPSCRQPRLAPMAGITARTRPQPVLALSLEHIDRTCAVHRR